METGEGLGVTVEREEESGVEGPVMLADYLVGADTRVEVAC